MCEFLSLGLIPCICMGVFKELRRLASSTRHVTRFVFLLLATLVLGAEFPISRTFQLAFVSSTLCYGRGRCLRGGPGSAVTSI